MIIITMASQENVIQVLKTLDENRIPKVPCYTYFALKHTIELHIEDRRIPKDFREDFCVAKNARKKWQFMDDEMKGLSIIWRLMEQNAVLVLQPAKVGSTSVYESLLEAGVDCIHSHVLASDWVVEKISDERIKGLKTLQDVEKIKIISMIRNPVDRDISAYFSCFQEYVLYDIVKSDTYRGIIEYLERHTKVGDHGAIFEWFDIEFKAGFDIDIFKYDFNKEVGYQIIKKDNIELLLIKVERLDSCQDIIGKFVGVDDFRLKRRNDGNEKMCKFAYDEVKKNIRIPEYILDFYYKGNRAMDHFYTEGEKKKFKEKWFRR